MTNELLRNQIYFDNKINKLNKKVDKLTATMNSVMNSLRANNVVTRQNNDLIRRFFHIWEKEKND